jgi:dolichyl-phosphate beta-glucosyltransferase
VDAVLDRRKSGGVSEQGHAAPTLSLVIPAYNEAERLPSLLEALGSDTEKLVRRAGFEYLETVIVDDGSTDATARKLAEAAQGDARIRPVPAHGGNRGKGAAVAAGAAAARGEFMLQTDVDLSTPLDDLVGLAAAVRDGADLAIGSRDLPGSVVVNAPSHRKQLGRAFNLAVRALTGMSVSDTQCGFKLMRTDTARRLLEQQVCPGYAYDVELLVRAQAAGLRIDEVPVTYVHDPRSRVRVASASVQMLFDVIRLSYRVRPRRGSRVETRATV